LRAEADEADAASDYSVASVGSQEEIITILPKSNTAVKSVMPPSPFPPPLPPLQAHTHTHSTHTQHTHTHTHTHPRARARALVVVPLDPPLFLL
jgi:hypothetical protein